MPDTPVGMLERGSAAARPGMVGGILVGGLSKRMGYRPKGLLRAPDGQTIVERWCRLFRAQGHEVVLVGNHPAYAHLGVRCLEDERQGCGPIGGLLALLRHAGEGSAVAVACDMPYVSERLLRALSEHPSPAAVVAPRGPRGWEPLFARYRAREVLPQALALADSGRHSLQTLLDALPTERWELDAIDAAELRDWDQPNDLP
jgi:molybdopterin-guanine dinucleotide biosynthesis protein A